MLEKRRLYFWLYSWLTCVAHLEMLGTPTHPRELVALLRSAEPILSLSYVVDRLGPTRQRELRLALARALRGLRVELAQATVPRHGTTLWALYCDQLRHELDELGWKGCSVIGSHCSVDFLIDGEFVIRLRRSDGEGRPANPPISDRGRDIVETGQMTLDIGEVSVVWLLWHVGVRLPSGAWDLSLLDANGIVETAVWPEIQFSGEIEERPVRVASTNAAEDEASGWTFGPATQRNTEHEEAGG